MDPNQQPAPVPPPQPQPQPGSGPTPAQPYSEPAPYSQPSPQPLQAIMQPSSPVAPSTYSDAAPAPTFDANYLDSIAPGPPRPKLFSGSFAKIFYIMIGVFVFAVSLIIAFSGKDKTADLQQLTVRVTNFVLLTKTEQKYFKSNKLSANNSSFQLLLTDAETNGEKLLAQAGVKKSQYDKTMVAAEKKISTDLTTKFENARLNASLDRIYAQTMAAETDKMITLYTTMSKKSGAKAIRDYAAGLAKNLDSIQKTFEDYNDDGN